jgi:hypothetical protein
MEAAEFRQILENAARKPNRAIGTLIEGG